MKGEEEVVIARERKAAVDALLPKMEAEMMRAHNDSIAKFQVPPKCQRHTRNKKRNTLRMES